MMITRRLPMSLFKITLRCLLRAICCSLRAAVFRALTLDAAARLMPLFEPRYIFLLSRDY